MQRIGAEVREYLVDDQERLGVRYGEDRRFFSEREVQHMVDVKVLMERTWIAGLAAGMVLAAILAGAVLWRRRLDCAAAARVAVVGGGLGVVIIAGLAVVAAAGFDDAFRQFHLLFFTNDLWQLTSRGPADPAVSAAVLLRDDAADRGCGDWCFAAVPGGRGGVFGAGAARGQLREFAPQPQEPRPQGQPPAMGASSRASRSGGGLAGDGDHCGGEDLVGGVALGALGAFRGGGHGAELGEALVAGAAVVLVDGHGASLRVAGW